MKTICERIIMLAALSFSGGWLFAQPAPVSENIANKSGIYMNKEDYLNGKMCYEFNCRSAKRNKIKIHKIFSKSIIKITYDGAKHILKKNDVYAYRDAKGITYRFYRNNQYAIVEPGGLYIYVHEQSVPNQTEFKRGTKYFFSKTPDGVVQELTLSNLISAYIDDDSFRDILVANFADGQDIYAYDSQNKMFKLNYLYIIAQSNFTP